MITWLSRALGVPRAIATEAPTGWFILAGAARLGRLDRVEAYAVGRYLSSAIRRIRCSA